MAYLDFKVTSWRRYYIPDKKVKKVIAMLKASDCNEVYEIHELEGVYELHQGPDQECEEPMIPAENGGSATQELYNEEGNIIYHNSENPDEY
jgi:hypothetical protein